MSKNTLDYSSFFNLNPLPSLVYDMSTFEILDANNSASLLYGYSKEELVSLNIKDLCSKEEAIRLVIAQQKVINKGENYSFGEFTHLIKTGVEIAITINGQLTHWEDRACVIAVCQNSAKQQSEIIQLIDASLDIFCTVNELGNFVYVSAASANHWGYTPQELIGKPYMNLVLEEDVPKTNKIAAFVQSGQDVKSFVNRYKKKDGGIAYNLWSSRWDNHTKKMYAVARDGKEIIEQDQLIQQSELRFKALVQEGADMVSIVDTEGNYIYVSPTSSTILGIKPEEFIGKNALEFIHPDDIEKASGYIQQIGTESKVIVEPFRLRDGNNEWRWIETVLTNMLDNPAVKGIVANSRDITEKVNALKKIEANELFNRTILESSPDCLKVLDAEGSLQYMNYNGLCQMEIDDFGAFKNKSWWTLWGSENEALVKASLDKALLGETAHFTALCPTAKGTPKWWDVVVSPVGILGEPVQQIISVSRDITKQKEEEHQLKLLSSVITNTKDAVLITEAEPFDQPGPRIIYVNEAFTQMTGYTAEEVIGKTPRILQGPNSNLEELAKLGKALRNWETHEITTINYKKNGEEFWVNFTVSPVADEKGWYTHWIAIERDVTEQKNKELENELLAQINTNFNEEDYIKSVKELCKTISKFGNFDWVELWTCNLDKSKMQLLSHYVAAPEDEVFYTIGSKIKAFQKHEGMPGKVWAKETQIQWDDISESKDFIRTEEANRIGLQSVLGIPLISNNEVVGVLTIGTKKKFSSFKNNTRIFDRLEKIIGVKLKQKMLENDFSHLFNAIPDILCLTDFKGTFLKMNKAGCELLGYDEEEILHHTFEDFTYPEDKDIALKEFAKLSKGKSNFKFENRYIKKNGDIVWLSWLCNSNIEESLIYATAKNITEEKKLRELNRQSNQLSKIGSWELNLVNSKLFWSEEVHQLHETDPETFVPDLTNAINFYTEDFRPVIQSLVEKCAATGEPMDFEGKLTTAKNKERWARVIGNAKIVDGQCYRIYGSFQDIHDRKEVELQLQSLADNLPGVIFQYIINPDKTDTLKAVTKGSLEIWGLTPEAVMENTQLVWDQILLGGDIEILQKSIEDSVSTKSKWSAQWKYVMPNGELRMHLGYGSPNYLADGTVVFNSMILDITTEAKNKELLEQVSKLAKIGSWEVDVVNQNIFWSDEVHQLHETDPKSFVPKLETAINFYRKDFREIVQSNIEKSISTGDPFDFEAVIVTTKKKEIWVRAIGNAEMIDGKCNRIYGSIQDIDDQKEAAQKLQQAYDDKNNIIESIADAFFTMDKNFKVSYWNRAAEELIGVKREQLIGKSLWEIFPDAVSLPSYSNYHKVLETGEAITFEDNYGIWLEVNAYPSEEGITVLFRDISLRKEADIRLLQANERFEKVAEATNDAIWDWNITENTLFWGGGFKKLFGYDVDKITPTLDSWTQHIHPDDLERVSNSINQSLLNEHNLWIEEYRYKKNDGTFATVIDRGIIIRDNHAKPQRMIGAMTDISERKKHEEELILLNDTLNTHSKELERSNEELEQFAFVASHDLQEPLRMISSFMDQLKRKYGEQLDEKAHQYIFFASDGAVRMKRIILDLLDFSRSNKPTEGQEIVDLNELIADFNHLRRKIISEKEVQIISQQLPTLNTYKAAVTQIFHSLLDNAIKYSRDKIPPVIEINTYEKETEWEFSIKDNGIGIDSQFHEKIFIIFQRLHNKDEYSGTGIGLSVAKRHINFLGGRIWLESIPEKGTIFYFTIPKI